MGTYVYTARASGRVKVMVQGRMHWVFPMKYSFKPWPQHPSNERWWANARRTAENVEKHKDWEGFVSLHGHIYTHADALYVDSEPFVGRWVQ